MKRTRPDKALEVVLADGTLYGWIAGLSGASAGRALVYYLATGEKDDGVSANPGDFITATMAIRDRTYSAFDEDIRIERLEQEIPLYARESKCKDHACRLITTFTWGAIQIEPGSQMENIFDHPDFEPA